MKDNIIVAIKNDNKFLSTVIASVTNPIQKQTNYSSEIKTYAIIISLWVEN